MYQFDQTMKAVTVGYFQLQHNLFAPIPVQYQNLCENSRLYEPGSQYAEFVKRLSIFSNKTNSNSPFTFETCEKSLDINEKRLQNVSESESGESGEEARTSPKTGPSAFSSTEELENDNDPNRKFNVVQYPLMNNFYLFQLKMRQQISFLKGHMLIVFKN